MPDPRGKSMSIHLFIEAYHDGDKISRRSQTGILRFYNRMPVMWFGKKKNLVQSSTFVSKFTSMKIAVDMTQAMR